MPECTYCGEELTWEDVYGTNLRMDSFGMVKPGFKKTGDIYICANPYCDEYQGSFYTDPYENLVEGYPC